MVRKLTSLTIFNGTLQTCFPCKHSSAVVSCCIVNACTRERLNVRRSQLCSNTLPQGSLQTQADHRLKEASAKQV